MENLALIDSFSEFKDDKLIDRVTLMSILEDVFRNALKRKYGDDDNFDIIINPRIVINHDGKGTIQGHRLKIFYNLSISSAISHGRKHH